jgi:hypothetical protein
MLCVVGPASWQASHISPAAHRTDNSIDVSSLQVGEDGISAGSTHHHSFSDLSFAHSDKRSRCLLMLLQPQVHLSSTPCQLHRTRRRTVVDAAQSHGHLHDMVEPHIVRFATGPTQVARSMPPDRLSEKPTGAPFRVEHFRSSSCSFAIALLAKGA